MKGIPQQRPWWWRQRRQRRLLTLEALGYKHQQRGSFLSLGEFIPKKHKQKKQFFVDPKMWKPSNILEKDTRKTHRQELFARIDLCFFHFDVVEIVFYWHFTGCKEFHHFWAFFGDVFFHRLQVAFLLRWSWVFNRCQFHSNSCRAEDSGRKKRRFFRAISTKGWCPGDYQCICSTFAMWFCEGGVNESTPSRCWKLVWSVKGSVDKGHVWSFS